MTLRWGIIGLGKIAHQFAKGIQSVESNVLYAVASRTGTKSHDFAKEHQSIQAYGSYEELFEDKHVDIVYIATPHNSHKRYSILAMQHGKHVLCEKPIAINAADAEEMIKCAVANEVFFMEALWSRFNPVINTVWDNCNNGDIGKVNYIYADFSFWNEIDETSRLFDIELGGGSLLDVGIYPAFLSYLFLGVPKRILSSSILHSNGVDLQTNMIFQYQDATANLMCGLMSKPEMVARIHGTEGKYHIHERWHEATSYSHTVNDDTTLFMLDQYKSGYAFEVQECFHCISNGMLQSEKWSHNNSIELMTILDEVRKQCGIRYPNE